ncbi:N-acyl-D-amino-acid deacylase family protein [Dyella jiangningensis]|uniref:Dihydroorotase n=1 Tax=Dyella jiangningensis TaxID=1379159 RepID=A0A328P1K8_9GAMM|nr:D-aminoacylase [Dyella jiangningensis]RAO74435.1 dihydroorotase [Dyella jiangningensis]
MRLLTCLLVISLGMSVHGATATPASSYDILIRNGQVIDGTGTAAYAADIAIKDGRIAAVGTLGQASAKQVIDAQGMTITPGFIDMLDQSAHTLLVDGHAQSKIFQGVTTLITGEGESVAPVNDTITREEGAHAKPDWATLGDYLQRLQSRGIAVNFGSYVGAATAREMVMGYGDRQPTAEELQRMQAVVASAMRDGAFGVSTGLQYPPATYSTTPELIALAETAASYGGIYATHMRSEGDGEMAALDEAFEIGRQAHIPVEIFHLKVAGHANWGSMPKVIARIDAARAAGLDVTADTYAYTAWGNGLASFIPPWAHVGGTAKLLQRLEDPQSRARIQKDMQTPSEAWSNDWLEVPGPEAVEITSVQEPSLKRFEGRRLDEVARAWHEKPIDALIDLLIKDHAATDVAVFGMAQPDVTLALRQPWMSVCDDAAAQAPTGPLGQGHPHPRAYAAFARIISKYVNEDHVLTLPEAIHKMTALPAQRMGLKQRGVIKEGMWADIAIFDPARLRAPATFEQPRQLAQGMRDVLVNGVPVIRDGKLTPALPGKVLHGPGFQAERDTAVAAAP